MSYLIYLRKSRADMEAEAHGEGETLARHEKTLTDLAVRQNLEVGAIYKEIVSGDSIAQRPQMQRLIQEVSAGMWEGVLVMEIERLARGDTIDQGIVAQTFKYSDTLIVTPNKTYDPANEFDENYFEFNLFMSRQEYKTIKRRLLAGRISSTKEGNYLGSNDPYGYHKVKNGKDITLEIVPEEAMIVKRMFEMYVNENKGFMAISSALDSEGIIFTSRVDKPAKVKEIIHNPIYKGYVVFGKHKEYYTVDENGVKKKHWKKQDDYIIAKGKHPAIVSEEMFDKAQEIADLRWHTSKSKNAPMRNKLQGLLICGKCGRAMRLVSLRRKEKYYYSYVCQWCDNNQATEQVVLSAVNSTISEHYENLKLNPPQEESKSDDTMRDAVASAKQELKKLKEQKAKIFEFYEREIYDDDTFAERMKSVKEREEQLNAILTYKPIKMISKEEADILFSEVIRNFGCEDIEHINSLYKTIITKIRYLRPIGRGEIEIKIQFKV